MELKSQFMMNIKDGAKAGHTPQPDPTLCPELTDTTCPEDSVFFEDRNNDGIIDKKTYKYYKEESKEEFKEFGGIMERIESEYDEDFNGIFEYETITVNGIIVYEARFDNETRERIEDKIYGSDGDLLHTWQYKYDENGNISKEIKYNPDGSIDRIINRKYDENGDYIGYVWVDDEGETHGVMKTFDENGKQIGEIYDKGDYGYTYLTDENGNCLKDENGNSIKIETGDIPHPTEGITTAGNMKANLNPVAKDQLHLK